jgi:hypothetical protein
MYFEEVEKARRFRDGSPLQRIEMRIDDMKHEKRRIASLRELGLSPEAAKEATNEANERITELEKEKAELLARVPPAES